MNRISSTVLLIAVALCTLATALGEITPLGWLLVYAGWTYLAQHWGRQFLAGLRAAEPAATPRGGTIPPPRPQRA